MRSMYSVSDLSVDFLHVHGLMVLCTRFSVFSLQVRYLKVIEKSGYQALPWVRYITTAGNYEIRMN